MSGTLSDSGTQYLSGSYKDTRESLSFKEARGSLQGSMSMRDTAENTGMRAARVDEEEGGTGEGGTGEQESGEDGKPAGGGEGDDKREGASGKAEEHAMPPSRPRRETPQQPQQPNQPNQPRQPRISPRPRHHSRRLLPHPSRVSSKQPNSGKSPHRSPHRSPSARGRFSPGGRLPLGRGPSGRGSARGARGRGGLLSPQQQRRQKALQRQREKRLVLLVPLFVLPSCCRAPSVHQSTFSHVFSLTPLSSLDWRCRRISVHVDVSWTVCGV